MEVSGRVRHALEDPSWAWWSMVRRTWILPGRQDYRRFIVLSRSRTGSNLLISYLNSHPRVHAEGERLARVDGRDPTEVLMEIFGPQPPPVRAKGFKIFYYHPVDADASRLWARLRADEELYVIHLRRRNTLRAVVSRALAERRDSWTTNRTAAPDPNAVVRLDADGVRKEFEQTEAWVRWGDSQFDGHPLLDLSYEELVADPADAFAGVADFLGVRRRAPWTEFRRQNPHALSKLIENYEELQRVFADTRWAPFFEG